MSKRMGELYPCVFCSKLFHPYPESTKKYCSLKCQGQEKRVLLTQAWLSGEDSGTREYFKIAPHIRDYLIDQAGHKCELCSWNKVNTTTNKVPLEIDHIDGNYKNNRPENLQVICANCHSLTPTYRGLNRGNGREHRRKTT